MVINRRIDVYWCELTENIPNKNKIIINKITKNFLLGSGKLSCFHHRLYLTCGPSKCVTKETMKPNYRETEWLFFYCRPERLQWESNTCGTKVNKELLSIVYYLFIEYLFFYFVLFTYLWLFLFTIYCFITLKTFSSLFSYYYFFFPILLMFCKTKS